MNENQDGPRPTTSPTPAGPHPSSTPADDVATLRALANPERIKILGQLRKSGPATVGRLADALSLAPGSVSYHLRTLARHGFVIEAPELAADSREHWWRAAADVTSWDHRDVQDPERGPAMIALQRVIQQGYSETLRKHLDEQPFLEPEWLAASFSGDLVAFLTPGELAELGRQLDELLESWYARGREPREGTRPVVMIAHAFPDPA